MTAQTGPTVACVYRSGGVYTAAYVRTLAGGVRRHWPGTPRIVCLTDRADELAGADVETLALKHGWPGWWSKMELFRPDVRAALGDTLFFDLDTVFVGPLDDIANRMGAFIVLRDFYRPRGWGSAMMHLPAGCGAALWKSFVADANGHMAKHRGDQNFLERHAGRAALWQDALPGQVVSYKADDCHAGPPPGARVVCFHGTPKPHELDGWIGAAWTPAAA